MRIYRMRTRVERCDGEHEMEGERCAAGGSLPAPVMDHRREGRVEQPSTALTVHSSSSEHVRVLVDAAEVARRVLPGVLVMNMMSASAPPHMRELSPVHATSVTFVESEGTLAIGAAVEDNATEEDEGITMLMLFTLNAVRAQLQVTILSPSGAMLQIDAARAVQKCVATCGSRAMRRCDVWQEKKAHSAHPRPNSTPAME